MMTSTFRWCVSALLAVIVLSARSSASAQPAATAQSSPTTQAPAAIQAGPLKSPKEYITRATQYFSAGDYDKAVDDYRAAYQMKQLPTLLFNIAQAQRKASKYQEALTTYERFLKDDPKSPLAPEAEAQATAMRARIDAEKATAERATAERLASQRVEEAEALAKAREEERRKAEAALLLATSKDKPVYKRTWFAPVMALVGVVVVGGIVVGALAGAGVIGPKDPGSDLGARVVQF
jgi:tetratricopeptide (TPR) repeat protein